MVLFSFTTVFPLLSATEMGHNPPVTGILWPIFGPRLKKALGLISVWYHQIKWASLWPHVFCGFCSLFELDASCAYVALTACNVVSNWTVCLYFCQYLWSQPVPFESLCNIFDFLAYYIRDEFIAIQAELSQGVISEHTKAFSSESGL